MIIDVLISWYILFCFLFLIIFAFKFCEYDSIEDITYWDILFIIIFFPSLLFDVLIYFMAFAMAVVYVAIKENAKFMNNKPFKGSKK